MSKETVLRKKDSRTSIEVIKEYILDTKGRVELSEINKAIYERLKFAWFQMTQQHYSRTQTVSIIEKHFGITERQAYIDVNEALSLFGDMSKVEKEAMRMIIYEAGMKTFQLAAAQKDPKAMATALKVVSKGLGLEREDTDPPDYSKLEQNIYVIQIDESQKKNIDKLLGQSGTIDLNKIEYLDYEELKH